MIEAPDFLPLGSVVRLAGNPKMLLVVGRALVVEVQDSREYYDYSLVLFPEGLMGDTVLYGNHQDIAEVVFRGLSEDEDKAMVATLNELVSKLDVARGRPQPVGQW